MRTVVGDTMEEDFECFFCFDFSCGGGDGASTVRSSVPFSVRRFFSGCTFAAVVAPPKPSSGGKPSQSSDAPSAEEEEAS
jgi:hypothetical protein